MADENYARLRVGGAGLTALTGDCDHPKPKFKNGKERLMCFDCRPHGSARPKPKPRPQQSAFCSVDGCDEPRRALGLCVKHYFKGRRKPKRSEKEQKECPACRGFFTPTARRRTVCSAECGKARQRASNSFRPEVACVCVVCEAPFGSRIRTAIYCSNRCKGIAWDRANPERSKELNQPKLCTYIAKHCAGCGAAWGARRQWERCKACKRAEFLAAARAAELAVNEAKHKARADVVTCAGCDLAYCPLYRVKRNLKQVCPDCESQIKAERKRAPKARRRAQQRSVPSEMVLPYKVFERDGWTCRLCGVATPKELRGTYAHNAPELDHITPLSRGGPHTYANTQCLCRSCNGWKSARTMEEVLSALAS